MDDQNARPPAPTVVFPVPADRPAGTGPTRGQARGPRWRRTSPNRYVPVEINGDDPAQRIVEVLAMSPGGAVSGWASLHLAGARYFDGTRFPDGVVPVPVVVGRCQARKRLPGGVVLRAALSAEDTVLRHGIRCTTVHRALFDEVVRRGELRQAVAAIEMAYYAELTSSSRFGDWLAASGRRVGKPWSGRHTPLRSRAHNHLPRPRCTWSGSWTPGCRSRC